MKNTWCRIITLENGEDVLLTKEHEEEGENGEALFQVIVTCDFSSGRATVNLGFPTDAERDKCFAEYRAESAEIVYKEISSFYQ